MARSILPDSALHHIRGIMDPRYRSLFQHVLPLFWPWLWWNLFRLDAFRRRVNRNILIQTDRMGNIRILLIGDAPKPDNLYSYAAPKVTSRDRLAPGFCLPEAEPQTPERVRTVCAPVRAALAHPVATDALVRGPP